MNVVIVGCGRTGAFLAELLDKGGNAVAIVDVDRAGFKRLPADFKGNPVLGDGTDMDILRSAGVEQADAFLALTQGDNRNLMAAQIAKKVFGVKQVIAKVNDPIRAATYRGQGIYTFSRTTILGEVGLIYASQESLVKTVYVQFHAVRLDKGPGKVIAP